MYPSRSPRPTFSASWVDPVRERRRSASHCSACCPEARRPAGPSPSRAVRCWPAGEADAGAAWRPALDDHAERLDRAQSSFTIGRQMSDLLRLHRDLSNPTLALKQSMAYQGGHPDARGAAEGLSPELSGRINQRITIAMGMSLSPKLVIADEATSALITSRLPCWDCWRQRSRLGRHDGVITRDLRMVARSVIR